MLETHLNSFDQWVNIQNQVERPKKGFSIVTHDRKTYVHVGKIFEKRSFGWRIIRIIKFVGMSTLRALSCGAIYSNQQKFISQIKKECSGLEKRKIYLLQSCIPAIVPPKPVEVVDQAKLKQEKTLELIRSFNQGLIVDNGNPALLVEHLNTLTPAEFLPIINSLSYWDILNLFSLGDFPALEKDRQQLLDRFNASRVEGIYMQEISKLKFIGLLKLDPNNLFITEYLKKFPKDHLFLEEVFKLPLSSFSDPFLREILHILIMQFNKNQISPDLMKQWLTIACEASSNFDKFSLETAYFLIIVLRHYHVDFSLLGHLSITQTHILMDNMPTIMENVPEEYVGLKKSTLQSERYNPFFQDIQLAAEDQQSKLIEYLLTKISLDDFNKILNGLNERTSDFYLNIVKGTRNVRDEGTRLKLEILMHKMRQYLLVNVKVNEMNNTFRFGTENIQQIVKILEEASNDADQYFCIIKSLVARFDNRLMAYDIPSFNSKFISELKISSSGLRIFILKSSPFLVTLMNLNKLEEFIKGNKTKFNNKLLKKCQASWENNNQLGSALKKILKDLNVFALSGLFAKFD